MAGGVLGRVGSKSNRHTPGLGFHAELVVASRAWTFHPKFPPDAAKCCCSVALGTLTLATVPEVTETIWLKIWLPPERSFVPQSRNCARTVPPSESDTFAVRVTSVFPMVVNGAAVSQPPELGSWTRSWGRWETYRCRVACSAAVRCSGA